MKWFYKFYYDKNINDSFMYSFGFNGYIDNFHKNSPGNLASLCEECHLKIHQEDKILKKKKTTKGIKLMEV